MRTLIAARDWLTVVRLPAYAPDLNPTEGVWAWMKRGITNIAVHGVDHLADLVRQRLPRLPEPDRPHRRLPRPDRYDPRPRATRTTQTSAFQPL
uniref:transposase n=1 Tax=Micromonospora tarapacensis TaxID=2835305 RepID=UPI001E542D0F|nr:transposase [Micromonospora tarapacensis]